MALAPELDVRYATIYGYLNDDLTRRHATVDLCVRVAGVDPAAFDRRATLVRRGLVDVISNGDGGPWRTSAVVVPEALRMHVLGAGTTMGSSLELAAGFDSLARRVDSPATWDDLALPTRTSNELRELESAIRDRTLVFREWGASRHASAPVSLRSLFAGPPGTGKTLAASVIANSVGLGLHVIDLSAVVSKYIGETEKHLERVFTAAATVGTILFFDEADALFGKRSDIHDSHDRYANIQVVYLLQRMERHEGVMILATNLTHNLDEAFRRRIHFAIDFPLPDERCRAVLWRLHVPPRAPLAGDLDIGFLAAQFQLSGGEIHNAMLSAAFLAAHEHAPIAMAHVIRAVRAPNGGPRARSRQPPSSGNIWRRRVAKRRELEWTRFVGESGTGS